MERGDTLGGRYELTEAVGSGGVGDVWRAKDELLDRTVAVKVLRSALSGDESTVRRFAAEARIMARLNHPGIAAVYDFGQDPDGTAYLVMRFVDGESLRSILADHGAMPAARAMGLVAQAAAALRAAHAAGVIHRDVKPGNLMVRVDGTVVLTDFGIARAAGNDVTGAGLVMGTARYLAPEQAAGAEITAVVDVYALGVTAYECLVGRPPFSGDNAIEVAIRHIEDVPPPLPRSVPEPVRALVSAMMAKDPLRRPTPAEVVVAAREAARAPVPAPVADGGGRRRMRILAGTAAGVTAVLASLALVAFNTGRPDPNGRSTVEGGQSGAGIGAASGSGPDSSPTPSARATASARTTRTTPLARPSATAGPGPTGPPATDPPPTTDPPADLVKVPFVVGFTEVDARIALEGAGFTVGVEDGPECTVTGQRPGDGTMAPRGSTVMIMLRRDQVCPAAGS